MPSIWNSCMCLYITAYLYMQYMTQETNSPYSNSSILRMQLGFGFRSKISKGYGLSSAIFFQYSIGYSTIFI